MDGNNIGNGKTPKGEIDLLALLKYLWGRKAFLAIGGGIASMLGIAYGFMATPKYRSACIIAPKEQSGGGSQSALLSKLGGFGGMVAGQLGAGSADLERLDLMVQSRDLAEDVVSKDDLLPRLFPKRWDAAAKGWKGGRGPSIKDGVDYLKDGVLSVETDTKRRALTLGIETFDSTLAAQLVEYYLEALSATIKQNVRSDADSNRKYLEGQLASTADPLLHEKIQQLIGVEIEKAMLVSSRSFDIMERPAVPSAPSWPRKRMLAILSFCFGGFATALALTLIKVFRDAEYAETPVA